MRSVSELCMFSHTPAHKRSTAKHTKMASDKDEENDADIIMMLAAAAVVIIEANEDPEDRLIVKDIIELEEHMFARNFVRFTTGV